MNITVYTTGPTCHKCTLTKRVLTKAGLPFTEVDAREAEELKSRAFKTAPVVHVVHDDGSEEWWDDFRDDRLKALAVRAEEAA